MTRAAIEAAGDEHDLWIAADDEDRPKQLYARLGFRPAWTAMSSCGCRERHGRANGAAPSRLRTTTDVVARRENRAREGRRPTGPVLLRIRTVDQDDRPVLDFTRCAMLPLRDAPQASRATRSVTQAAWRPSRRTRQPPARPHRLRVASPSSVVDLFTSRAVADRLGRAMLFMLINTPDPRYRGGADPDDERERRWEPISRRLFVPAAGSMSCFVVSPFVGGPFASWALTVGGVALCAQFLRASLREDPPRRNRPRLAHDDRE